MSTEVQVKECNCFKLCICMEIRLAKSFFDILFQYKCVKHVYIYLHIIYIFYVLFTNLFYMERFAVNFHTLNGEFSL